MKIYLKIKTDISISLQDSSWCFYENDILIIENIGEELIINDNGYGKIEKIVNIVWRLNEIIYNKILCIVDIKYKLTSLYPNLINATYRKNCKDIKLSNIIDNDIFEDISIVYNRDEKIDKVLKSNKLSTF